MTTTTYRTEPGRLSHIRARFPDVGFLRFGGWVVVTDACECWWAPLSRLEVLERRLQDGRAVEWSEISVASARVDDVDVPAASVARAREALGLATGDYSGEDGESVANC